MKKTFNINLSGQSFIIDEDAYDMLYQYLQTLSAAFHAGGTQEIVSDIESRMQELFSEILETQSATIITLQDVETVINRIGRPEDFIGEIETEEASSDNGSEVEGNVETVEIKDAVPPASPYRPKRLYRDPRNKILGGVCSGIAWYLGVDPVWVRIFTAGLCFLSLSVVAIVYIILWIIIPEANTPLQRLQMMGEDATVSNIGKVVTDDFRSPFAPSGMTMDTAQNYSTKKSTFAEILSWCGKAILIIIGIVAAPILIGMAGVFACVAFALLVYHFSSLQPFFPQWTEGFQGQEAWWTISGLWCAIGWTLTIGIPLFAILWAILKTFSNKTRNLATPVKITLLAAWILGFIIAAVQTVKFMNF